MLPSIPGGNTLVRKQSSNIPSRLQSQLELNTSALNSLIAAMKDFVGVQREVREECGNMAEMLGEVVKLQKHALKAEKNTLKEMKEISRQSKTRQDQNELEQSNKKTEIRSRATTMNLGIWQQYRVNLSGVAQSNTMNIKQEQQQPTKIPDQNPTELVQYGESRQQQILISVKSCQVPQNSSKIDFIKETISRWIGKSYDVIIKLSFKGYFEKQMKESEAKVFFCHNLMLNFQELLEYLQTVHSEMWKSHKDSFMEYYERKAQETLSYYLSKYPQKSKLMIDQSIRKQVKQCDYSRCPDYNTPKNLGCEFQHIPNGDYSSKIKRFLNSIITQSSKNFEMFKSTMIDIFTFQNSKGQKYQLDNLIGMKIKQGTPIYSAQEIALKGVSIKTPQMLRVVMKWVEELQEILRQPAKYFGSDLVFPHRDRGKVASGLHRKIEKKALDQLSLLSKDFGEWSKQNKNTITSACEKLLDYSRAVSSQLPHITPHQLRKTVPCYALSQVVAITAIFKLNKLITLINTTVNEAEKDTDVRQFGIQLIPFTVSDLLRCKRTGTPEQVLKVIQRLKQRAKIVRVKDRLNTSNQDFLVNVKMEGCPLVCEVQVGFKDKTDEKTEFLDHFNHFLYELARSEYGPLAQSSMIATNLTTFNGFFEKNIKSIRKAIHNSSFKAISKAIDDMKMDGYIRKSIDFSFLCSSCLVLHRANTTFLPVFQKNDEFICGECALETMEPEDKAIFFLGPILGQFFEYQPIQLLNTEEKDYKVIIPKKQKKEILIFMSEVSDKKQKLKPIFYEFNPFPPTDVFERKFVFKLKASKFHIEQIETSKLKAKMDQKVDSKIYFAEQQINIDKVSLMPVAVCAVNQPSEQQEQCMLVLDAINPKEDSKAWQKSQKIRQVTKSTAKIWKMQDLDLDQNLLQSIQIKHPLRKLKLSRNKISTLELFQCETLEQLYLADNAVAQIKHKVTFPNLQILDLSGNLLVDIEELKEYKELRVLLAIENRIERVDLKNLSLKIEIINLQANKIKYFGCDGKTSPNLRSINLATNLIPEINFEKSEFPSLNQIDLYGNRLQSLVLPKASFPVLNCLNCATNDSLKQLLIEDIAKMIIIQARGCRFEKMHFKTDSQDECQFQKLDMPDNFLRQIKFQGRFPHLIRMNLARNRLQELDLRPFGTLSQLRCLNVPFNHLRRVLFAPKLSLSKLEQFTLENNICPINFSCSLKKIDAPQLKTFKIGVLGEGEKLYLSWALRGVPEGKFGQLAEEIKKEDIKLEMEIDGEFIRNLKSAKSSVFSSLKSEAKKKVVRIIRRFFNEEYQNQQSLQNTGDDDQWFKASND